MSAADEALRRALGRLQSEGAAAALPALLACWRSRPEPRLAGLIERLSAQLPAESWDRSTVAEREQRWAALAERADPASWPTLQRLLWPRRLKVGAAWFALLARWPADPRIATALAQCVRVRPWRSRAAGGLYARMVAHLQHIGDVRALGLLPLPADPFSTAYTAIAHLHTILGERPTPTILAEVERMLTSVESALDAADAPRRALWEAVYADPGVPTRRQLLADHLLDAGDPQGMFIGLQLDGRPGALREADALRRTVGASWTPPAIRRLAVPGGVLFEGGLPVGVRIPARPPDDALEGRSDRAWRTVHTLWILSRGQTRLQPLLDEAWFLGLRHVTGAHPGLWRAAAEAGAMWKEVTVTDRVFGVAEALALLPGLQRVALDVAPDVADEVARALQVSRPDVALRTRS